MKNEKLEIIKVINNLKTPKVLVVGDFAIDEMVYGKTARISREAPVLILKHAETKIILGAASNAAHNISALNDGKVGVIGVCGKDYYAPILKKAFKDAKVDYSLMVEDKDRPTTTKTRISGFSTQSVRQQIVRIDRQTNSPLSREIEEKVIKEIERLLPLHDAIILSDYHIGTLSENIIKRTIEFAKKYSKKVIVDAQKDLGKYKGVFSMTPNLPDTQKHVGFYLNKREDFIEAGKQLISETLADNILITCGADGMVIIEQGGKYTHIPVFNKSEVFDVTGAGDTVTATYSLALATGSEPLYAAIIGNIAAGIVVKQFGCATTNISEILNAIPNVINIEN